MLSIDEDALICDLAEVYHVYDYRSLPASLVATFALGLSRDSRIKMKISGDKYPLDTLLLAKISDYTGYIFYCLAKKKGSEPPESTLSKLLDTEEKETSKFMTFSTPEEYEEFISKKRGVNNG